MILHVVSNEEFDPAPAQVVQHAGFFLSRILDTDVAPVYQFKEVSRSRERLEEMAQGAITFEHGAQELSREFSREHGNTARDGAFFIFELRTDDEDVRIYSLIKYDYREAIEQADDGDGETLLRKIVHAFIDDKKAIQKAALIRVVDGQAEPLLATRDRTRVAPEIADYFAKFLDVHRISSDEALNRKMVDALRETFTECKDVLPRNDVPLALRRAKAVLRDRQEIDEDAIVDAVMAAAGHPEQEDTKDLLRKRTMQKLRAKRLAGLSFRPDRVLLRKAPMRKIRTTEGVTILYPDRATKVRRVVNPGGAGETITITTDLIVEDIVVADNTR
ncbi:hypothetical protein CT3_01360 [Comamonas terrigena NBRC 13299]|nr:hypothetical protein CT3_01360 [Comamonas terrigena NBRC 13299]